MAEQRPAVGVLMNVGGEVGERVGGEGGKGRWVRRWEGKVGEEGGRGRWKRKVGAPFVYIFLYYSAPLVIDLLSNWLRCTKINEG